MENELDDIKPTVTVTCDECGKKFFFNKARIAAPSIFEGMVFQHVKRHIYQKEKQLKETIENGMMIRPTSGGMKGMNEKELEKELAEVTAEIARAAKKKGEIEAYADKLLRERNEIIKRYVKELGDLVIGKTYRSKLDGTVVIVKGIANDNYLRCLEIGIPGRRYLGNNVADNYIFQEHEILGTQFMKREYEEIPRSEFDTVVDEFIEGSGLKMPVSCLAEGMAPRFY